MASKKMNASEIIDATAKNHERMFIALKMDDCKTLEDYIALRDELKRKAKETAKLLEEL
jgi:hypothetical protein